MTRKALMLLLLSAAALLVGPVLADTTETQQNGEREHTNEHEHHPERESEPEREHEHEREPDRESPEREPEPEREHDPEPDDDSDSAPFMIVVQHENKRRCSGSLVSLRTALTSAWCVRGQHGDDPRELLALAPGVPPARPIARRVARVALATGADSDSPPPHLQPAWAGAALDIAVLELEAPFGGDARSRPILMATRPEDCDMSAMCHVVRAMGTAPRLRIVDPLLVPGERCAAVARGWPGLRDSALCLAGPELCESDRGAGVVCDGKLCGVLSRSARGIKTSSDVTEMTKVEGALTHEGMCGDVHVAQSVARWRRFLHCAHTLRACGSGGECAQLCSERQLMVMNPDEGASAAGSAGGGGDVSSGVVAGERKDLPTNGIKQNVNKILSNARRAEPDTAPPTTSPAETTFETYVTVITTSSLELPETSSSTRPERPRPRTGRPRSRTTTRLTPTLTSKTSATMPFVAGATSTSRPSFEFEPNRADFKGGPARTSRVYLKAGEYGDNAADYGGEEGALGPSPTTTPTPPSTKGTAAAGRISVMAAQQSATTTPQFRTNNCAAPTHQDLPFIFVTFVIYAL